MKIENSPINVATRVLRRVVNKVEQLTSKKTEEDKQKKTEKDHIESVQGNSRFIE